MTQKGYELLWGDALPEVIQAITVDALRKGTKEAFQSAGDKICGISSFIIYMQLGNGWDTDAIITLNACQSRMHRMAWDEDFREQILKDIGGHKVTAV